jgi:capsular exopolysaccharide synthesis family protein
MISRESIDLGLNRCLPIVRRQWIPAVSIFASTVVLGLITASYFKPLYRAEGKLLIDRNSANKTSTFSSASDRIANGNNKALKSSLPAEKIIDNQLELISAHPLLARTIAKLQLKDEAGKIVAINDLQARLELKIIGNSDVIQIKYQSPNPLVAARVVNTLMDVYLENDLQRKQAEGVANLKYINEQLPAAQSAANKAELALRQFKQKHQIVDLAEESKSAIGIMRNLETAIDTTRAQIAETTAQSSELRQKLNLSPQEAIAVSAISQSSAIQSNIAQLQEVERKLASDRRRFLETNPAIASIKEKQTNLTNLLQQQISQTVGAGVQTPQGLVRIGELKQKLIKDFLQLEVQRIGLDKKLASLINSQTERASRVKNIPQLTQEQQHLERQVEASRSAQLTLSNRLQELKLARERDNSTAQIIAKALVPERADLGNRLLIIGGSLLLGSGLAIGTTILLELRDKSLKTLQQVKDAFGYKVLGIIPAAPKKSLPPGSTPMATTLEVAVRDTPQTVTSEMSRTIQANVRYLSTDRPLKTIAISSSIANEGKSKVAANLAAAIAQVGQRVLLIDADLRVPYQHLFWKLPLKKGLREVLTKKAKLEIISWKVMNNLDILTAGSKSSDPLACLDSKRMRSLLQEVAQLYDFIIIDTPPILVASDALAVGRMTDGILLVARPGVIDARHAAACRERLQMSDCQVIGTIVNGIVAKNETENHFANVDLYFSDEPETDLPWTQYMTELGKTIADRTQQETGFEKAQVPKPKISN